MVYLFILRGVWKHDNGEDYNVSWLDNRKRDLAPLYVIGYAES